MQGRQFVLLLAVCAASSLIGSALVGARLVRPAHAQDNPILQPRVQDAFLVPNDGMRFVDEQGRVVALIRNNAGAGELVLMAPGEIPNLVLAANRTGGSLRIVGTGRSVSLGLDGQSGGLAVGSGR